MTRWTTRLKVLDAGPDSCSLTMGTVNFGDDVFSNPWPFVCDLYQRTLERQVVPEFELFDLGHVAALHRLLDMFGLPFGERVHCDLVMGVPGGMPGTADALVAAVQALPRQTTSWSATGIGRTTLAVAFASLAKGGHLRVGMEDTLTFAKGVPVTTTPSSSSGRPGWPSWRSGRRCRPTTPGSCSRSGRADRAGRLSRAAAGPRHAAAGPGPRPPCRTSREDRPRRGRRGGCRRHTPWRSTCGPQRPSTA